MDVIPGVLGEKEFTFMNDDTLKSLGPLVDDKMATILEKYMADPNADQGVVNRIRYCIGDDIEKHSFHFQVIDSGVVNNIRTLNITTLAYSQIDLDEFEKQLQFLEDNKNKMYAYIEPRSKKDFEVFLKNITELNKSMSGLPRDYTNLPERVMANKDFFYSPREKSRPTRLGMIINRSRDCSMALAGIKFIKYCNTKEVPDWMRREF